MNIINKIFHKPPIPQLIHGQAYQTDTLYGGQKYTFQPYETTDKLINHMLQTKITPIAIKIQWGQHHLPVIDADTTYHLALASAYLQENNLQYTLIESNPNKYWIIVDYPNTIQNTLIITKNTPGNDPEYIQACQYYQHHLIRGHYKNTPHQPKILTTPENPTPTTTQLTTALQNYYQQTHQKLLWLHRQQQWQNHQQTQPLLNPTTTPITITNFI